MDKNHHRTRPSASQGLPTTELADNIARPFVNSDDRAYNKNLANREAARLVFDEMYGGKAHGSVRHR